ncbi:MAG: LysR family transcriptional regulator [Pseudomonadota bacterium]
MKSINFKQLQAFVQVADLGSFRRAAEILNTTQPNISARIKNLEAQLDVVLMDRVVGSVRVTPQGRVLLAQARQVLAATDAFVMAAGNDALLEGILRLGVTETIIHSWLGRYVETLNARFPNVSVELLVDLSDNLTAALKDRSIDLAIQSGPFVDDFSGQVALDDFPMVWVGAPATAPGPMSFSQLAMQPLMTSARGTEPFRQVSAHLADAGITTARLVPSSNLSACIKMAEEGLGFACVPRVMVEQNISSQRLVEIDCGWAPNALSFSARYDAETAPAYARAAAEVAEEVANHADPKK